MTVVALRLGGPLQAWGSDSRFVHRRTEMAPTKSGVVGLVAAAKGMRRADPIEELVGLRMGVRVDQPGRLIRDFQTAHRPKRDRTGSLQWTSMPISYRYYLSDATFLAVLEGDPRLIEGIDAALRSPYFPLFLGRRSCPPSRPVALGVFDLDLAGGLTELDWQASLHEQRRRRDRLVSLETVRDAESGEPGAETMHDQPVSFDPNRRTYAWRAVVRGAVTVENPHGSEEPRFDHDAMQAAGG